MFNFTGGMLTGHEIEKQVKKGNIEITPYDPGCINPNSYNLKLHPQLLIYRRDADRAKILRQNYDFPIDNHLYVQLNSNTYKEEILNKSSSDIHIRTENKIVSIADSADSLDERICWMENSFNAKNSHILDRLKTLESLPNNNSYVLPPLDMKTPNETIEFEIPEEGYILQPGVLYIGRTVERTWTDKFIPMINGRSSGGRLGISIHICAGFGDVGFDGTWTLEITVVEPVRIYPNTEIAQVCYFKPCGKIKNLYRGRYQGQTHATPTRFFLGKNKKNG